MGQVLSVRKAKSMGRKSEKISLLLFDNNVYRKIVQNNPFFSKRLYLERMNKHIMATTPPPYRRIMTPFSVMEALGIKIKRKPQIIHTSKAKPNDLIDSALRASASFFEKEPYLSRSALLERLQEQLEYWDTNRYVQAFINETLVATLNDANFPALLHSWLAFDHLLTIANWPGDQLQLNKKLLIQGLIAIKNERDISLFRLMYRIFTDVEQKATEKKPRPFKLESRQDYLDTEIVHYPLFGDSVVKGCPVTVVTEDNPDEITAKLKWAKMILRHTRKITPKSKLKLIPQPIYGYAVILDSDGNLARRVEVKKLKEDL